MNIKGEKQLPVFEKLKFCKFHDRAENEGDYSPLIRVDNHKSPVLSCEFHSSGEFFLSSNLEGQIHVDGMLSKILIMQGHCGAVNEVHFSHDGLNIYSCSADETIGVWDAFEGVRSHTLKGHQGPVNCVQTARLGYPVLCSGGKDGTMRVWDVRVGDCVMALGSGDEILSTCFVDTGDYLFTGGRDNDIRIWDLRMCDTVNKLKGHGGSVTGLSLSPSGAYLLSHSVDNSLRVWNVRPYTSFQRHIGSFPSHHSNETSMLRCAWSPDGGMITCGTSTCTARVLDASTGSRLLELAPHDYSVNDVAFHPTELIMISASNDNRLFVHELSK